MKRQLKEPRVTGDKKDQVTVGPCEARRTHWELCGLFQGGGNSEQVNNFGFVSLKGCAILQRKKEKEGVFFECRKS